MLRMAFRNLKRNRRRTVLTISAIVIGIIFSTLILAWVNGAGAMMVEEGKRISGDIRLTAKDFILKFFVFIFINNQNTRRNTCAIKQSRR